MTDRYELVEGKASKFWEVGVEGVTLTVTFGRIGTDGQTKAKDFSDAAAATKEKDKLVREKTGKGYAPVDAGAAAPVKPAVAKAEAAEPSPPKPEPTPAESQPSTSVPRRVEPEEPEVCVAAPTGEGFGLLFKGVPLPTRTRPGLHIDADGAYARLRALVGALLPADDHADWVPPLRNALARPVPQLDAETAETWVHAIQAAFDASPPHSWKDRGRWLKSVRAGLDVFARVLVEASGARVAAQLAVRLLPSSDLPRYYGNFSWGEPLQLALRAALVHAPEAAYAEAIDVFVASAETKKQRSLTAGYAFILADDGPTRHSLQALAMLEDAEAAGVDVGNDHMLLPLVVDAPPVQTARWRARSSTLHLNFCAVDAAEGAATLVAVAAAAEASPLSSLAWFLVMMAETDRTIVAKAILETREPEALATLMPVLNERWVRPAFDAAGEAYPASIFAQCLAALASGRDDLALRGRVAETLDRFGAEQCCAWAVPAGARAQSILAKLIEKRDVPMVDPAAWPCVLREPPWRQKARVKDDIVLDLTPIATPDLFEAKPGEPDHWRYYDAKPIARMSDLLALITEAEHQSDTAEATMLKLPPRRRTVPESGGDEAMLAWLGERLRQVDEEKRYYHASPYFGLLSGMEQQPEPLALMLWSLNAVIAGRTHISVMPSVVNAMLARFGAKALPGLVGLIEVHPISVLVAAQDVDTAGIAPPAARALFKLKKARVPALAWLRRHRETAMMRLVPDAVGKPGAARDAAEHALRTLVADRDDGRAALDAVVARYAEAEPRVAEAIAQVLERDPFARVPSKVGRPPAWVVPSALARPRLREGGGALPDAAVLALVEMLSFVNPDDIYAGVPAVRDACTPDSLAAFAWDLFSAWIAAGAPSKDGWALRAIGWLGDDSCARELTRLIRRWPGESAHQRAVTGLDVLADVGSDVALMNLNGIAEKLKFKGLQEKARAKIAVLAEARGLSPEELSDRLAPDLDLDERGGLDLDFGPRSFRAGFDELLKPWVKDATGQRLKDLPKPIKSDDAEKGAAAVARWAALKKDARAVATLQLNRLEAMLATSRRVTPEVFQLFFAAHPLVRHLAQRLVWATFADADPRTGPDQAFRVAEDLSFTDADDAPIEIDVSSEAAGLIGLLHPLHLGADTLVPWGTLFGDYEITQPFPQLGRETFAFTPAEAAVGDISRFDGVEVESARVRGMGARGWPLGTLADHGVASWIEREVAFPDGTSATVSLMFENGIFAGARDAEDATQTLRRLSFDNHWTATQARGTHIFGALDPVTASELLRGPSLLAGTRVT